MTGKKKILVMLLSLSFILSSLYVFAQDDVRATGKNDDNKKKSSIIKFYTADGKKHDVEFDPEGEDIRILTLATDSQLLEYPDEARLFADAKYKEEIDGDDDAEDSQSVYLVDGDQYIVSYHMISYVDDDEGGIERVQSEAKAIKAVRTGENPVSFLGSGYKSYKWFTDKEATTLAKSIKEDGELYAFDTVREQDFYYDQKTGILVKIDADAFDSDVVNLVMQRKPIHYKVIGPDKAEVSSNVYSFYFTNDEDEKIAPNRKNAFQVWLPIPDKGEYEDYEVIEVNSEKAGNNTLYTESDLTNVAYQSSPNKTGGSVLYKCLAFRDINIAKDYTFLVARTKGKGDKCSVADPNVISGKIPNPNTAVGILNQAPPEANLATSSKLYSLPNGSYMRECIPSGIKIIYPSGTFANDQAIVPELYALNYSVGGPAGPIKNVSFTLGFKDGDKYVDPLKTVELEVPYSGLNAQAIDILRQTGENSYATVAGVVSSNNVRFSFDRSGVFVLAESYNVDKTQLKMVNLGVYRPTASQIVIGNGYVTPATGEEDMAIFAGLMVFAAGAALLIRKKVC